MIYAKLYVRISNNHSFLRTFLLLLVKSSALRLLRHSLDFVSLRTMPTFLFPSRKLKLLTLTFGSSLPNAVPSFLASLNGVLRIPRFERCEPRRRENKGNAERTGTGTVAGINLKGA